MMLKSFALTGRILRGMITPRVSVPRCVTFALGYGLAALSGRSLPLGCADEVAILEWRGCHIGVERLPYWGD